MTKRQPGESPLEFAKRSYFPLTSIDELCGFEREKAQKAKGRRRDGSETE